MNNVFNLIGTIRTVLLQTPNVTKVKVELDYVDNNVEFFVYANKNKVKVRSPFFLLERDMNHQRIIDNIRSTACDLLWPK